MELAHILEATMLLAFGASWPAQIIKTIKTKNPSGKSFIFLYLVMFGYLCGISAKLVPGNESWVMWVYVLDLMLIATDTTLSHYYMWKLKKQK